jgi:hypothetical protein
MTGEHIMKVKSCFGIMAKIDFNKILKIMVCAIRIIFLAVQNFQSFPLNVISNLGDLIVLRLNYNLSNLIKISVTRGVTIVYCPDVIDALFLIETILNLFFVGRA